MKKNYKWIVLISFLALIFLPKQMPIASLKWAVIILTTALCIYFEFISLKDANKSETKQTYLLMVLTLAMAVVNIMI
jgi:hypothetical protein